MRSPTRASVPTQTNKKMGETHESESGLHMTNGFCVTLDEEEDEAEADADDV